MMSMGFSYAQVHLQQEQCKERIKKGDQALIKCMTHKKREEIKRAHHRGKVHPITKIIPTSSIYVYEEAN